MDWKLKDEQFSVCSNIQCGWISHVYSRRYAAKTPSLPFSVYSTMSENMLAISFTPAVIFAVQVLFPSNVCNLDSHDDFIDIRLIFSFVPQFKFLLLDWPVDSQC